MTLDTLQPEQLDSLVRLHSGGGMSEWTFERVEGAVPGPQFANYQDINDSAVMQHFMRLLLADPDDRLDYLKQVNPDITDDQSDRIALIAERWLDDDARSRMRALARRCYYSGAEAHDTLLSWYTTEEMQRLIDLLSGARLSDLALAMCYAVSETHDTAYAAYFICKDRAERDVEFGSVVQTPEDIAGDVSFVNAR